VVNTPTGLIPFLFQRFYNISIQVQWRKKMSRPFKGEEAVEEAREVMAKTKSLEQYRQALAVVLPLCHGMDLEETAQVLSVTPRWASWLRNRFIAGERVGETENRGGRHHAYLTEEEEAELLHPLAEKAAHGGILVVGQIKAHLETQLERPWALSSVYALLHRQGWRKLAPDKRHPQSNPEAQEAWKKNFPTRLRKSEKNSLRAYPSA
jgi:transposase